MKKYFSRPGFGARFGSFMLCVAMLLCLLSTVILADIRIATEKDNLSTIIKQTLLSTQSVRLPSASGGAHAGVTVRTQLRLAAPKLEEESYSAVLGDAMVEMVYNIMLEQSGGELDVTLEEVRAFVDESTLGDFVADTSAALVSDLITGENTIDLSEETISGLLEENAPLIEEYFGVVLDAQTIAIVTAQVTENEYVQQIRRNGVSKFVEDNSALMDDMGLSNLTGGPSGGSFDSETSKGGSSLNIAGILNTARSFTSTTALICCIVAVAVFIGLLCLANFKHVWYAIRGTGRTFIISTFLISVVTAVMMFAPTVWSSVFSFSPMIGKVSSLVLQFTAPVHFGILAAGVALAVLGTVLKFVAKGKARKLYLAELAAQDQTPVEEASAAVTEEEPAAVMGLVTEDGLTVELPVADVPAEDSV